MRTVAKAAIIAIFAALYFLAGCSQAHRDFQWGQPSSALILPSVDNQRIRLIRTVSPGRDFPKKKEFSVWDWFYGADRLGIVPLVGPYGVAADGDGRVWIADPLAGYVHFLDLAANSLVSLGGEHFVSPACLAYDENKKQLYVADTVAKTISVFSPDARLIRSWNLPSSFGRPGGLVVEASGTLLVVDVVRGLICRFSSEGGEITTLGSDLGLNGPTGLALARDGNIVVVDSLNFRVAILSHTGQLIRSVGGLGDAPGKFARPRGVATDSEGNIYVSDAAFDNVQIFSQDGELLLYMGGAGSGEGQFSLPAGLYMDRENRLYVVDSMNRRVQIYQVDP